jgi:hypothetical protein
LDHKISDQASEQASEQASKQASKRTSEQASNFLVNIIGSFDLTILYKRSMYFSLEKSANKLIS